MGVFILRDKNRSIIMSYINLRRLIGILGILLPFTCMAGGFIFSDLPVQNSISFYYHTNMRDFFIGLMAVVSLFLITYKGYETIDIIITTISGIAGLGIAFFPCLDYVSLTNPLGIFQLSASVSNKIHIGCALVFFILLAVNSIFLFTLSKLKDIPRKSEKYRRNFIYRICGIIIFLCIILLLIFLQVYSTEEIEKHKIVLFFETIMLIAFGISWLIKGETIYKDRLKKV